MIGIGAKSRKSTSAGDGMSENVRERRGMNDENLFAHRG
jgi:hypothetical protein